VIGTFGLLPKKTRKFFPEVATSAKKGKKRGVTEENRERGKQ
jgi:hypothetical protein